MPTDDELIRDFIEGVHAGEWSGKVSRDDALEALDRLISRCVPEVPEGCRVSCVWENPKGFSCEVQTTKFIKNGFGLDQYERLGAYGFPTIQAACKAAIAKTCRDLKEPNDENR